MTLKRNCLYAELDPFTGSIPQSNTALKKLLIDLKMACLLYDSVIVPACVFFEHSLCLPAFIHLAPFVKSGVLWTSIEDIKIPPETFILKSAEKYFGRDLNKGLSKIASEKLKRDLEIWSNIAPSQWQHSRQIEYRVQDTTDNILANLAKLSLSKQGEYAKALLTEFFMQMQEDQAFNRNQSLAKIGSMRELVTQKELSVFYLIVQGEYTLQGFGYQNASASMYPGEFIKIIHKNSDLIRRNSSIPVELEIIELIKVRLHDSGFSLPTILSMSVQNLFHFSQSKEWKNWRAYLLSDRFSQESIHEMKSLKKIHYDLLTALEILLKNIDPPIQNRYISHYDFMTPNTWLTSGLSASGCLSNLNTHNRGQSAILNMSTRTFRFGESEICLLSKFHINFIVLLASTANEGTPIEIIKQLDLELNLQKSSTIYFKQTLTVSHSHRNEIENESRLNRINVHKRNLNQKLAKLDLHISGKNKHWQLVRWSTSEPITLELQGTPWAQDSKTQLAFVKPKKMTRQQNLIWTFCCKRPFCFFSFKALAIELKRHFFEAEETSSAEISKILNRFSKEILDKTQYQLLSDKSGNYCFIIRDDVSHK